MKNQRTDNSHLSEKIHLRLEEIKDGASILDCYHGYGTIWDHIAKKKDITVLGIEKEKWKGVGAIHGECEKVIPSLDLSSFDVIDCDAWGSPYKAIKAAFENNTLKPGTVFFYTYIQTMQGMVDKALYKYAGIPLSMRRKCPTIFKRKGFDFFKAFLYNYKVTKIKEYHIEESGDKHYGTFIKN